GFLQIVFQVGDFLGHDDDFVFDAWNTEALNVGTSGFGGDELDARGPGTGIGLVALLVIPVKVRVDDISHGLGSQLLDLCDEGTRRGGLGVGVNHKHTVVEQDNGGIAVDLVGGFGDGGVDAIGNRLDVEHILVGKGQCGKQEEY